MERSAPNVINETGIDPRPLDSEALPLEMREYLDTFHSFLKDELPDMIASAVRQEIKALKQPTVDPKALLDSRQACERLNVSRRKLDSLVASGALTPIKIGRKNLYPPSQIEAFLRRCSR